ncbi:unnamed protein product [Heterobilharzia americana]|nr:unnamed protein product [Heterobilharzia americana]
MRAKVQKYKARRESSLRNTDDESSRNTNSKIGVSNVLYLEQNKVMVSMKVKLASSTPNDEVTAH